MFTTLKNEFYNIKPEGSNKSDQTWQRVTFTLLSMMVSASVMASYSITTFYVSISFVAGGACRTAFFNLTHTSWQYETTNPEPIIKLIEYVVQKRHEEDLVAEEESYRMLQEILRSPELLKGISGSSLKGSIDPKNDRLSEEDKKKLAHLDNMERKGFDVAKLKEDIFTKHEEKL